MDLEELSRHRRTVATADGDIAYVGAGRKARSLCSSTAPSWTGRGGETWSSGSRRGRRPRRARRPDAEAPGSAHRL